ncbi:PocR ligand-binding domain-containing protein [Methanosarcina sp.]|uniref:PocR ligand-binding domain-containing protein n=1 Tax=Methanosarcina sp. TaxID=2213 RepID=UPI002AB8EF99|nr:PocR ligand-binding domain-containing protein [Methanosarcina sp.]MDY9927178.1 PocR ligand-binding domain-containing protein [Methanosarcina sp.]
MKAKTEQFPAINLNPVLCVAKDGTVLYSNEAGESLLREWGVEIGGKLPSTLGNIVQKVITRNNPEKMEIKAGNRVYLVVFHPFTEKECVNVSGFDISYQKELENDLWRSKDRKMENLGFADIIDIHAVQSLMDDFYKFANIPIGIFDLNGNILVGAGWQEICTRFHRVRPETCKHCVESDTKLSSGVSQGEYKLYKCKNNMWDIATPIFVGRRHIGNIFLGQFFFEGEIPNYDFFQSQARQYGFDEEKYIKALEKVPRLSKEAVDTIMTFFMNFANMLSQLGYSNIKLSQLLAERNAVVDALRESEKREQARSNELAVLLDAVPAAVWITHDTRATHMTGNRLSYEWLRLPEGTNISRPVPEGGKSETYSMFKSGVEIKPADMPVRISAAGKEVRDYEFDLIYPDGTVRHLLGNASPLRDEKGNSEGSISAFIDITERKQVEKELLESESRLRLAQVAAGAGIWNWDIPSDRLEWSEELFRLFGLDPEKYDASFDLWRDLLHPDDRLRVDSQIATAIDNHTPIAIEYRIVLPSAEVRWINALGSTTYDSNGKPQRVAGICIDITERKKAEEALKKTHENLEKLVKERTAELEKAYKSLKESEKGLAEAQKMAHIGNWSWDLITGEAYWSEEIYYIFGVNPQKSIPAYDELFNYIHPDDRNYVDAAIKKVINEKPFGIDYRIITANGKERTVHAESEVFFDPNNNPIQVKGIIQDITERKEAEKALANIEIARKKEIHHRIKNNLQVISSLLDLQADKFDNPKVIEAFKESQNRVISMALIHEELYKGEGTDTLNFSTYIRELAENLFHTYCLNSKNIRLCMDMEENALLNMDTAVPLGIIVNELVSNSFKHAFPDRDRGEIGIKLLREKNGKYKEEDDKSTNFVMAVSDNGVGIPKNLDIEDLDSLGIQLVITLVEQLDGELELKRDNGTEFIIKFKVIEKNNPEVPVTQ